LCNRDFYSKAQGVKTGLAIFHLVLIILCVYTMQKKWHVTDRKLFWSAFLLRLMAGISLGLIYTYYYSANDTWLFFEDAQKLSTIARRDFSSYLKLFLDLGDNQVLLSELSNQDLRSIFFIKIISVFNLISDDNYWVCAGYFSLLSFATSWHLHRRITEIFPDSSTASASAFLFFPSVVFWGSGIEKETLALSGIYFLTTIFLSLFYKKRVTPVAWLLAIFAGLLVWNLKYYWGGVFFITALSALALQYLITRFSVLNKYSVAIWVIIFIGTGMAFSISHPNFYLSSFLEVIVSNHTAFVAISSEKNLIHFYNLSADWKNIFINAPWALFSGLFRPLVGEGRGLLGFAASAENFLLLLFFISSLRNSKKAAASPHRVILLAVISYCIVQCVFLALSTPNMGTLSRYRVGFLPFFVFVITYRNPVINWLSNQITFRRV
jgi:hypothetical protein